MRSFIASYYPALIILFGAIVVAVGGFFASWRQTNFNAELRAKNDQIIALQDEQIKYTTGGDNFCYLMAELPAFDDVPAKLLVVNEGNTPIFDVNVVIHPGFPGRNAPIQEKMKVTTTVESFHLGTVLPSIAMYIDHTLIPGRYQIELVSRNVWITQMLKLVNFGGKIVQITDVYRRRYSEGAAEKVFSTPPPEGYKE
jgi:hypothetical protein